MQTPQQPARGPGIEVTGSRHFLAWLGAQHLSLALTTYHSNRLFLIGIKDDGRLSIFQRQFERAMGLAASSERLLLATRFQLWQLDNVLAQGERSGTYDRLYKPHIAWTTGDIDIHDVAFGADGQPVFINSLFSCLATLDERHSFRVLWKPPFTSKLAPEDRCHLNGMAMENGEACFVTAVSGSDVAAGWRSQRGTGGMVMEVPSGEVVASGLSMPHSPRLRSGKLWLLNSGTGELGTIDLPSGRFEPVCFCPGYARGLAFHGDFALVGLSKCREERTFAGLALDERLRDKRAEARCGVMVIDINTGSIVHWVELGGELRELYDVQVLPGIRCPSAVGLKSKEIWGVVTHEEEGRLVRHTGIVTD